MIMDHDISPFEMSILKNVIDLYVEAGKPVSSKMIKLKYGHRASTANIRQVLHKLEERGFLYKPHVSAGRVPSDTGYRWYVNSIQKVFPLNSRMREEVRNRIGQDLGDMRDIMRKTARLLGEITNYMGLMMGVMHSREVIKKLSIIQLDGGGGMVVLTLVNGGERKVRMEFPKRYSPHIINRAGAIINEHIAGYSLEQAQLRLDSLLKYGIGIEREIAGLIAEEAEYLFDWAFALEYHFGIDKPHNIPELSDPRLLHNLVRIMGEKKLMLDLLKSRIDSDILVTIGKENQQDEFEEFSIVTQRFQSGEHIGVLGILGPTRMSYPMVFSLLNGIDEEIKCNHG
ncbi:MAG: heat-inducible transcription repressor HrcA [Candidatus Krumholzibacteriota bacterium]|nr:heat-inducible transcription repressor HrcA [Candidatus Krumholzibacteriota bacterium]